MARDPRAARGHSGPPALQWRTHRRRSRRASVCHDGLDGEWQAPAGPCQLSGQDPAHDSKRAGAKGQSIRGIVRLFLRPSEPQGLAWNGAGELFVTEHGQIGHDEINLIRPGANYGWPLISGNEKRDRMETPVLDSGSDTWAPSGAAFAGTEL